MQRKRVCNAKMRDCKGRKPSVCKENGYATRKYEIARAGNCPYAKETGMQRENARLQGQETVRMQRKRVCNAKMRDCKGKKSSVCKENGYATRKCEVARAGNRPYAKKTGMQCENTRLQGQEIVRMQSKRVCNAEMRDCEGKKSSVCNQNGYATRKCEIARAGNRPYAKKTGMQRENARLQGQETVRMQKKRVCISRKWDCTGALREGGVHHGLRPFRCGCVPKSSDEEKSDRQAQHERKRGTRLTTCVGMPSDCHSPLRLSPRPLPACGEGCRAPEVSTGRVVSGTGQALTLPPTKLGHTFRYGFRPLRRSLHFPHLLAPSPLSALLFSVEALTEFGNLPILHAPPSRRKFYGTPTFERKAKERQHLGV